MKKVIYLLTLSFFVYGCSKEDSSTLDSSQPDLTFKSVRISLENLKSNNDYEVASRTGESGANGHFSTQQGNTISFSSGDDGEFGNWNQKGVVNFKGEVICATVEGNQTVVQVVITEVGEIPVEASGEIVVGYTFLFFLEDNGEGRNAPSDRYWNYSLYIPAAYDFCLGFGPADYIFIFGLPGFPEDAMFEDTAKSSDQIQVN